MKRFLVTTALEETWPEDQPMLFLGEWCRRFSRREKWSKLDADVLPYHWDDRGKLFADYQYLQELHERLLADLAVRLNEIHEVEHGLRYWRILVGPWLGYFVPMLFDRWSSIQRAVASAEITGTFVFTGGTGDRVPHDMDDFIRLFLEDEWNHELCATILREFTPIECFELPHRPAEVKRSHGGSDLLLRRFQRRLARWYAHGAGLFVGKRDVFLLATYLPLRDEVRLHWRLRQVPQLWRPIAPVRSSFEPSRRNWTLDGEVCSAFEACARQSIPRQIPLLYLEGYAKLIRQTQRLPWPTRPRAIWTSVSENADDVFKAWAADKVEQGAPLVIGQHGGHFGVGRWSFSEEHQMAISDRYFSWGWTGRDQIVPVGQLKAKHPLGVHHAEQQRLVLVTAVHPRFSYMMYSVPIAGQWLEYFADQYTFVAQLPARIRDAVNVRLYPQDLGWDQRARWRDRFPGVRVDEGCGKLDRLLRCCRIYVSTYNATTFLESLTMDIPTVIYWNPAHWELRDSALPYFAELKRVAIFHDNPISAAHHVSAVWNNVDHWWRSTEVRSARSHFMNEYCRLPENLVGCVEHALRQLIEANSIHG